MKNQESVSTLVWAVDLFGNDKLLKDTAWAIRALTQKLAFQIQPVYVIVEPPSTPHEYLCDAARKALRSHAQDRLNESIREVKLKGLLPVAILRIQRHSLNDQVKALLAYAHSIQANGIAASTRANHGATRFFLGSFVESLTLKSNIPLFIVNPSWKRSASFKDILFPTDFSQESEEAFEKVIQFARSTRSKVLLFHKYLPDFSPIWMSLPAGMPTYVSPNLEQEDLKNLEAKGQEWIQKAKAQGVRALLNIERSRGNSVSQAILKKNKTGSYLIAMASQKGPVEAALLGSVTRQIVRQSPSPIWILHPPTKPGVGGKLDLTQQVEDANQALSSTVI